MKRLEDIFDIYYGVNLEVVNCEIVEKGMPFVSRQSTNNGIVCHVKPIDIVPNPERTLSIAASGSVLSTYYHKYQYYSGRDVYIAEPKQKLSDVEILFYAYIIEQNKYRYNYGRQANRTLRDILVPSYEELPYYINKISTIPTFNKIPLSSNKLSLNIENWKWFYVKKIFETIESTKGSSTTEMVVGTEIMYIAAKKTNNGVNGYFAEKENEDYISKGNCIVFIQIGAGSAGFVTYQPIRFIGMSGKTSCGYNKYLNPYIAIFLIAIIDMERPRYSFGRSWTGNRLLDTKIKLPATKEGNPDWEFMENYIKSLPYSACL